MMQPESLQNVTTLNKESAEQMKRGAKIIQVIIVTQVKIGHRKEVYARLDRVDESPKFR